MMLKRTGAIIALIVISLAAGVAAQRGPAAFIAVDPDGNPILVDQHV